MTKRAALVALTSASALMLLAFLVELAWGAALFAVLAAWFPVALMALGAERRGRLGTQAVPLVALAAVLPAVMVALLMLRGQGLDGPWFGGLPAAAAALLYGLFLLPLVISSLGYAWSFERWGLRREDLDLLRRRFPVPREADDPAGVEGSGVEDDGGGAGEA